MPGINGIANVSDVMGVLAVIFGLAGWLSMGALQVRAGLAEVFGVEPTTTMSSAAARAAAQSRSLSRRQPSEGSLTNG